MALTGPQTRRATRPREALILILAFTSVWIAYSIPVLPHGRDTDFRYFYIGASLALHWDWSHMYIESGRGPESVPERHSPITFNRPPVYAIIVSPLALLPFLTAFWFWISVQSGVLLGCWAWAWKRFGPEAAVWAAFLSVGPLGIANGQDCAFFLALLCGAFVLGEKKRMFLCGLVLGLGLMKFHLFLLWPLVLLIQRRWRMLAGFIVCGLGQGLLSLAVLGWSGLWRYTRFVLHLDRFFSPARYLNINAILINIGISSLPLLIVLTGLVVGMVLWCCRRTSALWMTFTLATAGSLLISPHVYGYDATMLLLPAWCVIFLSGFRIAKLAAATICTPITTFAQISGPPLAGVTALILLVFVVGVCLASLHNHEPSKP
jgi:hypothetical protein